MRAEAFPSGFPDLGPPVAPSPRLDHRFRAAFEAAKNVMAGETQREAR